jgi:transcriptional regulator with XRE-family HTH domain
MMYEEEVELSAITPDELRERMNDLGLSQAALSRLVGVDKGAPGRWLSGAVPVPLWLVDHLGALQGLRGIAWVLWGEQSAVSEPTPLPGRLAHYAMLLSGNESRAKAITQGGPRNKLSAMMHATGEATPMSAEDFRKALKALKWKQMDFVRRAGVSTSATNRWAQGKAPIPGWVPLHLALLAQVQDLHERFVSPSTARAGAPSDS